MIFGLGGGVAGPRGRQKTTQDERPVPGKGSGRGGTVDWCQFFRGVGPRRSRPFPQDLFLFPGCVLTAPGPRNGPRRPKTTKNRNRRFFSSIDEVPGRSLIGGGLRAPAAGRPEDVGRGRRGLLLAPPPKWVPRGQRGGKFYDFGFSSFSASGGRFWAPGPSKTNPG